MWVSNFLNDCDFLVMRLIDIWEELFDFLEVLWMGGISVEIVRNGEISWWYVNEFIELYYKLSLLVLVVLVNVVFFWFGKFYVRCDCWGFNLLFYFG